MRFIKIENTEYEVLPQAIECPHCSTMMIPFYHYAIKRELVKGRGITALCTCIESSCEEPFLVTLDINTKRAAQLKLGDKQYADPCIFEYEVSDSIPSEIAFYEENVSERPFYENFVNIYSQSSAAYEDGGDEIAGPGYRRALEFLLKDYASFLKQDEVASIRRMSIVTLIRKYFPENPRLQNAAERAAWLGNDEVHYERVFEDKDVEDLKRLIQATAHWIEYDVLTREYALTMEDPKNSTKNAAQKS